MTTELVQLEDVSEMVSKGSTPTSQGLEYSKTGIPFLRAEDIQGGPVDLPSVQCRITPDVHGRLTRSQLQPFDLLVTIAGTLGRVGFVPLNATAVNCNQAVAFARLKPELIDVKYACYACQSPTVLEPFLGLQKVGTIGNLNLEQLRNLKIPLPSLSEQQRIAGQLEQADRLRRTRRYALELSDTFLPAAFLELFGDPVQNEKDWDFELLEDVCDPKNGIKAGPFGSSLKKEIYSKSGIRIYGQEQVIAGDFSIGDYYISLEMFEEFRAYEVKPGDLLLSLVGTFGKVVVVPGGIERGIINPRLLKISPLRDRVDSVFLAHFIQHPIVQASLERMSHGGTMGILTGGLLKRLHVIVPPLPKQEQFAALVVRHERLRAVQRESLRQSEHLFQSLLHHAFTDRPNVTT